MKRFIQKLVLPVMLLVQLVAYSQSADIQKLEHKYFTSWFSAKKHIRVVIQYDLTKSMVQCADPIARTNKFVKDPDAPEIINLKNDYRLSGYDKGHNMPAADNGCYEIGMTECFYFSNMTPQPHYFNAGVWKSLETKERTYALAGKITVFAGSIGKTEVIGDDEVVVPKYMWKVIYFPKRTGNKYDCYLFPNTDNATPPFTKYKVSLDEIEEHTSLKFTAGKFEFIDQ